LSGALANVGQNSQNASLRGLLMNVNYPGAPYDPPLRNSVAQEHRQDLQLRRYRSSDYVALAFLIGNRIFNCRSAAL